MLFLSEELKQRLSALMQAAREGDPVEAMRRVLEVKPDFGPAWTALGASLQDWTEAEAALWKGLWLEPCRVNPYMALADFLTRHREGNLVAKRLRALALWKLSFADEVPKYLAEHFAPAMGPEAKEPESYGVLANMQELEFKKAPEPPAVTAKLRPYDLLNDLQRQAPQDLSEETLGAIIQHADECGPLFRNALREWARREDALDDDSLRMLIAILGEISGPDAIDDLLELASWSERVTFLHVHWALHRLAEKYPEAALDRFRAAASGADVSLRCAIADQIHLMEPLPGAMDLLVSLVNGLAAAKSDNDAPYLLACVIHVLLGHGERERAKAIGKLQSLFGGAERELVREALRDLGGFTTILDGEEIAKASIEDVCVQRVLMDDDEDEEIDEEDGGEFENELEDELDLDVPAPRPGRNDPCWCGSGKKYKKCHLTADESAQHERSAVAAGKKDSTVKLQTRLMQEVVEAAFTWHSDSGMRRAKNLYFGDDGAIEAEQHEVDGFLQWVAHDFRDAATGRTAIEQFLHTRGAKLTRAERELLESLRDARFGVYEVQRVEPGSGIEVRDLFDGDRMFVHDISSSNSMARWDCLLARMQFEQGRWVFAGNGSMVPRHLLDEVRALVERESRAAKQSPAEFVRANSHRLHRVVKEMLSRRLDGIKVVNNEGEEVSFGRAEYQIEDTQALLAKLRVLEELEEGTETAAKIWFTWIQTMGQERRPMGHVEIESGSLRLEAMSRTRLQTLRGLIEFHAGPLITHQGDHYTSVEDIKDRVRRGERAPEGPVQTPEALAAVARVMADHYAGWADQPLPALGGKTPRQAVRTSAGRETVIELIRGIENGEDRRAKTGAPVFDCNILRRHLRLTEE